MRRRGFTLLEIVIAAMLVTLVMIPLVAIPEYAQYVLNKERHLLSAMAFANHTMENFLFQVDYDDPLLANGINNQQLHPDPAEIAGDAFWTTCNPVVSYSVQDFALLDAVGNSQNNVAKKIGITINWTEPSGEVKSQTVNSLKVSQ